MNATNNAEENNTSKLNLIINAQDGSTKTVEGVCFLELNSEKYSLYSFNEIDGNLTKVYASKLLENAGVFSTTVMSEEEWNNLKQAMREAIAGNLTKFFTGPSVITGDLNRGIKIETVGVDALKYNYINRNSIEKDPMVVVDQNVSDPEPEPQVVYSDNFSVFDGGVEKPVEAIDTDSIDVNNVFTNSMTPTTEVQTSVNDIVYQEEAVEKPEDVEVVLPPQIPEEKVEKIIDTSLIDEPIVPTENVEQVLQVPEEESVSIPDVKNDELSVTEDLNANNAEIQQMLSDIEDLRSSMEETVNEAKRYFDEESKKITDKLINFDKAKNASLEISPTTIVEDKLINTSELPKLSNDEPSATLALEQDKAS